MSTKKFNRASSHLYLHRHTIYFRFSIPRDVRPILGQSEYRRSLGSSYTSQARPIANRLTVIVQEFIDMIRQETFATMENLTPERMQALLRQFVEHKLEQDEQEKSDPGNWPAPWEKHREKPTGSAFPFHTTSEDELQAAFEDYLAAIKSGRHDKVKSHILELINLYGLEIEEGSAQFNRLCREYLKAQGQVIQILEHHLHGNFTEDQDLLNEAFPLASSRSARNLEADTSTAQPSVTEDVVESEGEVPLSQVISEYLDEYKHLHPKTIDEYTAALALLQRIIGDISIGNIDRVKIR